MTKLSVTQARSHFGETLKLCQSEPVHIQRHGRDAAVMLSAEQYRRLIGASPAPRVRPIIEKLHAESIERYGAVYEALAKK